MIPDSIKREHVEAALAEIAASVIPASRHSVDYDLVFDGKPYPPKYVVSVAAKHATGTELSPDAFSSGSETNGFLKSLGFDVVPRTKAEPIGIDADLAVVRATVERLVPDEAARRLAASIMAEAIQLANEMGTACWEITLKRDLVRLNGGRIFILDFRTDGLALGLDPALVDEKTNALLSRDAIEGERFALLPTFQQWLIPYASLASLWPGIAGAFRPWVTAAASTGRKSAWSRSHTAAVVEYLAELVGTPLERISQPR